jgi:hypothetical protein
MSTAQRQPRPRVARVLLFAEHENDGSAMSASFVGGSVMSGDPNSLLLVSCRHCRRPIALVGEIDELERHELQQHLRGCITTEPVASAPGTDELLQHFRIAGDR